MKYKTILSIMSFTKDFPLQVRQYPGKDQSIKHVLLLFFNALTPEMKDNTKIFGNCGKI